MPLTKDCGLRTTTRMVVLIDRRQAAELVRRVRVSGQTHQVAEWVSRALRKTAGRPPATLAIPLESSVKAGLLCLTATFHLGVTATDAVILARPPGRK